MYLVFIWLEIVKLDTIKSSLQNSVTKYYFLMLLIDISTGP